MSKWITRKEFYAGIRYLRESYLHGEISEEAFSRLVKLASSEYYGQKLDKMLEKIWRN